MITRTIIESIKGSWQDVVDSCRVTVNKPPLGREPSYDFKRKILISEHSPIRCITVRWLWPDLKSWVATHWSRHKWECFIRSQRTDRTGVERDTLPQDAPVDFAGEANCQHLVDTFRKRLCYQAAPETRMQAEDFKSALHDVEPEISDVLVPNCIYRCGCPEMQSCGWYNRTAEKHQMLASTDISERYGAYNQLFYGWQQ